MKNTLTRKQLVARLTGNFGITREIAEESIFEWEGALFGISLENGLPGPYDSHDITDRYATCLDGTGYFIEFIDGGTAAVYEI